MHEGRIGNSVRNFKYGLINTIVISLIPFITRTVFIHILGKDYLGIDALFLNIINLLEIVNVGIGSAITYSVYKPIADGDIARCRSLFRLYKKCYYTMGICIFAVGMALTPFLDSLLREKPNIPESIYAIYLIILVGVASGYFFMDKQCVITAHQKGYLVSRIKTVVIVCINAVEIAFLFLTKKYMVYLVIQTSQNLIINLLIARKARRNYPQYFGGKVEALIREDKERIIKNTTALIFNRAGSLIINCTDNIVISTFVGVGTVGLYSNYLTLKNMVNTVASIFTQSLTASIGNLNASEVDAEKKRLNEVFNQVYFINFLLYAFCTVCLVCLLEPFIHIWIGDQYIMGLPIVIIVSANFYFIGLQKTAEQFKAACGLYWQDRFRVFIESLCNIIISIVLVKRIGVLGVLLGTLVSNLCITFWVEPYIVFKYALNQKFHIYLLKSIVYSTIVAAVSFALYNAVMLVFDGYGGIGQFVLRTTMTVTMTAGMLTIIFFRNPYFRKTLEMGKQYAQSFAQRLQGRVR